MLKKFIYPSLENYWSKSLRKIFTRKMSQNIEVIFEEIKGKGIITLNRPKALNALNLRMIRSIYPKLKEWQSTKSLVIIKGSGEKAFCAGGDILAVTDAGKEGKPLTKEFFKEEYLLNHLIGSYKIPYIALIQGITMGGGVGLSVHGKFRVATEKTLFAMPETGIGLFPDVGGSYFLARLPKELGMYLALTGYRLKSRNVQHAGIATHLCNSSSLNELETKLLNLDPSEKNIDGIKEILDYYTINSEFDLKEFVLAPFLDKIENFFSGTSLEDILNRLQSDDSEWARKQIETMNKMSPTSLKITYESIRRGQNLSLADCLSMEYRLTQRCCEDKDFYEGVRAVLVDKDNAPKWNPNSLSQVNQSVVDRYFSKLPTDQELVF